MQIFRRQRRKFLFRSSVCGTCEGKCANTALPTRADITLTRRAIAAGRPTSHPQGRCRATLASVPRAASASVRAGSAAARCARQAVGCSGAQANGASSNAVLSRYGIVRSQCAARAHWQAMCGTAFDSAALMHDVETTARRACRQGVRRARGKDQHRVDQRTRQVGPPANAWDSSPTPTHLPITSPCIVSISVARGHLLDVHQQTKRSYVPHVKTASTGRLRTSRNAAGKWRATRSMMSSPSCENRARTDADPSQRTGLPGKRPMTIGRRGRSGISGVGHLRAFACSQPDVRNDRSRSGVDIVRCRPRHPVVSQEAVRGPGDGDGIKKRLERGFLKRSKWRCRPEGIRHGGRKSTLEGACPANTRHPTWLARSCIRLALDTGQRRILDVVIN
jgi:hypothetical protein